MTKIKKSVKKSVRIAILIVLALAVIAGIYFGVKYFIDKNKQKEAEIVEKIDAYGYYLENDAPKAYKTIFKELTNLLKEEEVNKEEYAKKVALLLAIDYYNLGNKVSKNDIGGIQFVLEDYRTNFFEESAATVYKYIENNLYGNREQELPKIESATIKEITEIEYELGETSYKGYQATVTLVYEKDLGYPADVTIKMIDKENKLEVVEMK